MSDEIKEYIAYPKHGTGFSVFFIQAKNRKQALEILKARFAGGSRPTWYRNWYLVNWNDGTVQHLNADYLK
jgi:hypothetical protein